MAATVDVSAVVKPVVVDVGVGETTVLVVVEAGVVEIFDLGVSVGGGGAVERKLVM